MRNKRKTYGSFGDLSWLSALTSDDDADQKQHDYQDAYRTFDVQPVVKQFDERREDIIQKSCHKNWRKDRRDEGPDRIKNKIDFGGNPD